MASETDIANLAAVRIGTESRITSLDDNKVLARSLKAVWATERQAVLRDGTYNFATTRKSLPALSANQAGEIAPWDFAYQLPTEALRLLEVRDLSRYDGYELEGRKILTYAAAPLLVRYVVDVAELSLWDSLAVEAFATRLAWKVGPKIAGSAFNAQACWAEYREAIGRAKGVDARENPPIPLDDGEWIEARRGAWNW